MTGTQPTVTLPVGRHVITVIADDGFGGASRDEVVIEVVDTTPPEIRSAIATPNRLWPPNHKMRPTVITVDVTDICDENPTCRIISVTSNEPDNGVGDGNTEPDWEITGALTLNLRAERSGGEWGGSTRSPSGAWTYRGTRRRLTFGSRCRTIKAGERDV